MICRRFAALIFNADDVWCRLTDFQSSTTTQLDTGAFVLHRDLGDDDGGIFVVGGGGCLVGCRQKMKVNERCPLLCFASFSFLRCNYKKREPQGQRKPTTNQRIAFSMTKLHRIEIGPAVRTTVIHTRRQAQCYTFRPKFKVQRKKNPWIFFGVEALKMTYSYSFSFSHEKSMPRL